MEPTRVLRRRARSASRDARVTPRGVLGTQAVARR